MKDDNDWRCYICHNPELDTRPIGPNGEYVCWYHKPDQPKGSIYNP